MECGADGKTDEFRREIFSSVISSESCLVTDIFVLLR
jgi:hypothetical protein